MYRYVGKSSVSWNIPRKDLLRVRLRALERRVLRPWIQRRKAAAANSGERSGCFTLWGAGRDGKTVLNELGDEFVRHVRAFCDVDPKKIARGYHNPRRGIKLPVVPFTEAVPPVIVCVAMGRTDGLLEKNIASMGWVEGRLLALDLKRVLSPSPCLLCVRVSITREKKKNLRIQE